MITKIEIGRGKNYPVDPIGTIGPHNTWINAAGTRVYMEVLTLPWIFIADTATNKVIGKTFGVYGPDVFTGSKRRSVFRSRMSA